jgi:hypothetical protein
MTDTVSVGNGGGAVRGHTSILDWIRIVARGLIIGRAATKNRDESGRHQAKDELFCHMTDLVRGDLLGNSMGRRRRGPSRADAF